MNVDPNSGSSEVSANKGARRAATPSVGKMGKRQVMDQTFGSVQSGTAQEVEQHVANSPEAQVKASKQLWESDEQARKRPLGKREAEAVIFKHEAKRPKSDNRIKEVIKDNSDRAASENIRHGAKGNETDLTERTHAHAIDPKGGVEVFHEPPSEEDFLKAAAGAAGKVGENPILDEDGDVFFDASDKDLVDDFIDSTFADVVEANQPEWITVISAFKRKNESSVAQKLLSWIGWGGGAKQEEVKKEGEIEQADVNALEFAVRVMTPKAKLDSEVDDIKYQFQNMCTTKEKAIAGQVEGRTHLTNIGKAWQKIHGSYMDSFSAEVARANANDPDFQKAEKILEKRNAQLEEISNIENEDEREAAFALFDEYDDLQFKWAYDVIYDKTKSFFEEFVETYYVSDKTYQECRDYLKEKLTDARKLEGPARDEAIRKLYREDAEFRDANEYVVAKRRGMMELFGCTYRDEDIVKLTMSDIFPELAMVKEHWEAHKGKYTSAVMMTAAGIAAPVAGLGAAGAMLAVPVGSVFAYKVGEKAIPTVQEALAKRGMFADVQAAKEDRAVRMPYLAKIFAAEVSMTEKLKGLEKLHNAGLLFSEDLEGIDDEIVKKFKEYLPRKGKELNSFEDFKTKREKLHVKLRDRYNNANTKFKALKEMHKNGLLYRQDVDFAEVPEDARNLFFEYLKQSGETYEDLFDSKAEGKLRQELLSLAKAKKPSLDDQLSALLELREKGMLFKQDLQRIKNHELRTAFFEKISFKDLAKNPIPDIGEFYSKEVGLKRLHDSFRDPYLKVLNDPVAAQEDKIAALLELESNGLCFRDDFNGVSKVVLDGFLKQAKKKEDSFDLSDSYYSRNGVGSIILRQIQAAGNIARDAVSTVYHDESSILYGALSGIKGVVQINAEAMEETFGVFTDVKTTALSDRVASVMPGDQELKRKAIWATNKTIGAAKWAAFGGVLTATVTALVAPLSALASPQTVLGAGALGGVAGAGASLYMSDGNVRQISSGSWKRAFKFVKTGALFGAVMPVVLALPIATIGSAFAAAFSVAMSAGFSAALASSLASAFIALGSGLVVAGVSALPWIIPCIILGAYLGYVIAGLTAKREAPGGYDFVVEDDLKYTPPSFEIDMPLGSEA